MLSQQDSSKKMLANQQQQQKQQQQQQQQQQQLNTNSTVSTITSVDRIKANNERIQSIVTSITLESQASSGEGIVP